MDVSPEKQLERIRENAVEVIPEDELLEKLRSGRPLRVKYGVDPSGPDVHLESESNCCASAGFVADRWS